MKPRHVVIAGNFSYSGPQLVSKGEDEVASLGRKLRNLGDEFLVLCDLRQLSAALVLEEFLGLEGQGRVVSTIDLQEPLEIQDLRDLEEDVDTGDYPPADVLVFFVDITKFRHLAAFFKNGEPGACLTAALSRKGMAIHIDMETLQDNLL